jgi:hypothetical protein
MSLLIFAYAITNIISKEEEISVLRLMLNCVLILVGIINFFPLSGYDKTSLIAGESDLKIRWRNQIREKLIRPVEVKKIILGRKSINFELQDRKPLVFPVDFFEKDQRQKIYLFIKEYAKTHNLSVEQHGGFPL